MNTIDRVMRRFPTTTFGYLAPGEAAPFPWPLCWLTHASYTDGVDNDYPSLILDGKVDEFLRVSVVNIDGCQRFGFAVYRRNETAGGYTRGKVHITTLPTREHIVRLGDHITEQTRRMLRPNEMSPAWDEVVAMCERHTADWYRREFMASPYVFVDLKCLQALDRVATAPKNSIIPVPFPPNVVHSYAIGVGVASTKSPQMVTYPETAPAAKTAQKSPAQPTRVPRTDEAILDLVKRHVLLPLVGYRFKKGDVSNPDAPSYYKYGAADIEAAWRETWHRPVSPGVEEVERYVVYVRLLNTVPGENSVVRLEIHWDAAAGRYRLENSHIVEGIRRADCSAWIDKARKADEDRRTNRPRFQTEIVADLAKKLHEAVLQDKRTPDADKIWGRLIRRDDLKIRFTLQKIRSSHIVGGVPVAGQVDEYVLHGERLDAREGEAKFFSSRYVWSEICKRYMRQTISISPESRLLVDLAAKQSIEPPPSWAVDGCGPLLHDNTQWVTLVGKTVRRDVRKDTRVMSSSLTPRQAMVKEIDHGRNPNPERVNALLQWLDTAPAALFRLHGVRPWVAST